MTPSMELAVAVGDVRRELQEVKQRIARLEETPIPSAALEEGHKGP